MEQYEVAKFYDNNMELIDTNDITVVDVEIPSIPFENNWTGGDDGIAPIYQGTDIKQREIKATVMMVAHDVPDYYLLRSDLYAVFGYGTFFYIILNEEDGKRYKIILNDSYLPERLMPVMGKIEIPFITSELPFAESVGTTQDIERDGVNSEIGLWGFGMGLLSDDESQKYTHQLPRFSRMDFKIYNAGNVPIHPFDQELKIRISNVVGSTEFLELKNKTNGTTFRVKEKVTSSQTVLLDGPNITINSLQSFRKTNRQYIELSEGWNEFEMLGATGAKVDFDFPFYYR